MKQTHKDIWNKAIDLVGGGALEKLAKHGLVVMDQTAIDRFMAEQRASNSRIRETAAAAMRAAGVESLRLEMVVSDGMPTIIATAPAGDENELAHVAGTLLADAWEPPEGWRRTEDGEGRSVKSVETMDVATYGAAVEPVVGPARARAIVAAIVEDLCDRRGLKSAWSGVDDEVCAEITAEWERIVQKGGA